MKGNIDILIITETKLDMSFPINQFNMEGYFPPFRADCSANGGGVAIYVRNDITCTLMRNHPHTTNLEGIFLEMNLRKSKWLLLSGYNPNKRNITNFMSQLIPSLDFYRNKYDNFLMLGDFNSEMSEYAMEEFCEIYNITNLIKEPTCFKNPLNPSTIDLNLTNMHETSESKVKSNKIVKLKCEINKSKRTRTTKR